MEDNQEHERFKDRDDDFVSDSWGRQSFLVMPDRLVNGKTINKASLSGQYPTARVPHFLGELMSRQRPSYPSSSVRRGFTSVREAHCETASSKCLEKTW